MIETRTDESPVGDLLQSEYHKVKYPQIITESQSYDTRTTTKTSITRREPRISSQSVARFDNNNVGKSKKYRPSQSVTSSSKIPRQISPLNDSTFSPPPIPPVKLGEAINISRHRARSSSLPSFDKITHSGHMLARTTLKSIIIKKWRPVFWISYGESEIFIFRSKSDFEEWATNPYLTVLQREKIVKLSIDFKIGPNHTSGVRCFRAFTLQAKDYKKTGSVHTFKLEQWMHYGPVIIGAFGSRSQPEIWAFNVICREMMTRNKSRVRDYLLASDSIDDDVDVQSHPSSYSVKSAPMTRTPGFY